MYTVDAKLFGLSALRDLPRAIVPGGDQLSPLSAGWSGIAQTKELLDSEALRQISSLSYGVITGLVLSFIREPLE
jgi:hypothetical protein